MTTTRPESIRKFDLAYLASLAISVLGVALSWEAMVEMANTAAAEGGGQRLGQGVATVAVVGGTVMGLLIGLALWFLVSRKRIGLVRWIIALFAAYSVFSLATTFSLMTPLMLTLNVLSTALTIAAVYFLFRPDASAWFETRRSD